MYNFIRLSCYETTTHITPCLVIVRYFVSLRIHNASSDSINRHFIKNDDCNSVDFLRELLYVNTEKSSKLQYKQEQFPVYVAVIEGVV